MGRTATRSVKKSAAVRKQAAREKRERSSFIDQSLTGSPVHVLCLLVYKLPKKASKSVTKSQERHTSVTNFLLFTENHACVSDNPSCRFLLLFLRSPCDAVLFSFAR
jgi:hypothetical protein